MKVLLEMMEDRLATKDDIRDVREELRREVLSLRHEIQQVEAKLTIKLGAMQAASIALIVGLIKLV